MFNQLSDKLTDSFRALKGMNKISEQNIEDAVKSVRMSLLEADVHFSVVKKFIENVKQKALGAEVLKSVSPGDQFIKIVHEELVQILGGASVNLEFKNTPSVIFLVGLQGAGKTTTAAKLALLIRKIYGKKPGLVPADIYRPAAILQLQQLAQQNDIPVFNSQANQKPEEILTQALQWAKDSLVDVVLVDTAGRLQIDESLMQELSNLKQIANPREILLVADAMLGQQAVNVAEGFHKQLGLTGLVLTKVDGDARGGAALSIREATGVPIKFIGMGEKVKDFEVFHPDRLAGRILDMGDVLSLVEKAQEVIDHKQAEDHARKMAKNQFTIEDFLQVMQQMKMLGGLEGIMGFLPGFGEIKKQMKDLNPPENEMKRIEAMIRSMTKAERNNPKILNGSRRERIAKGSGTKVQDINRFVKQFEEANKMMSKLMKMGLGGGKNMMGMPGMGPGMGQMPGKMPKMPFPPGRKGGRFPF